jgi:predicted MFS family arabinose efflux permease
MIFLISAIYSSTYALTLAKGIFYDEMMLGFQLNNLRFGQLFSALGVCSMIAYLCAAWFSSRFSSRSILLSALFINVIVPVVLSQFPPYPVMLACFAAMGFTNGIFYPTSVNVLRSLVPLELQGHAFGLNYIFISLTGTAITLLTYAALLFADSNTGKLTILLILTAVVNAVLLLLTFVSIHPEDTASAPRSEEHLLPTVFSLLRSPTVWAIILVVFINYIDYCTLNYTQPYLTNVVKLPAPAVNLIAILRMYFVVMLAAPLAGRITDRYRASIVLIRAVFLLYAVCTGVIVLLSHLPAILLVLLILAMCMTANMARSMSLITISEIGLTPYAISVAMCLISFLGYSPDAFYYSLCGWTLDRFGASGYHYIFAFTVILTGIGFVLCHWLRKKGIRRAF